MTLISGARVGRFALVELAGTGGQGSVWRAHDGNRTVAVKIVRRGPRLDAEVAQLRKLAHPSLARFEGLEEVDDAHAGIVLGWVDGHPLASVTRDSRWGLDHAAAVIDHLVHALVYVHARGLVHRDIKPANILVLPRFFDAPRDPSAVVLVDFGIATRIGNPQHLTGLGATAGTVAYLPPEVHLRPQSPVEPSRDVFALGLVGWELLAGVHPLGSVPEGADPSVWYAIAYREVRAGRRPFPVGVVSHALKARLLACLALDPAQRPRDANTVLEVQDASSTRTAPQPSSLGAVTRDYAPPIPRLRVVPRHPRRPPRRRASRQRRLSPAGARDAPRSSP